MSSSLLKGISEKYHTGPCLQNQDQKPHASKQNHDEKPVCEYAKREIAKLRNCDNTNMRYCEVQTSASSLKSNRINCNLQFFSCDNVEILHGPKSRTLYYPFYSQKSRGLRNREYNLHTGNLCIDTPVRDETRKVQV